MYDRYIRGTVICFCTETGQQAERSPVLISAQLFPSLTSYFLQHKAQVVCCKVRGAKH
ncbi:hypothetical protein TPHV1_30241 [Treponema phagedenis]|uniref:Uncharacterized protein n=1 Tax=Treponema phagedenis TaxID=162 RepID=A0A0B7H095_TREPH|nr:hypothetical protein TPHV1_30241 [Treponema phagedenis]